MTIETSEEFESWLREQTNEACVLIAARAALRVFPIVTQFDRKHEILTNIALATARALLTAAVTAKFPTAENRALSQTAYLAIISSYNSADTDLLASATNNAFAFSAAYSAADEAVLAAASVGPDADTVARAVARAADAVADSYPTDAAYADAELKFEFLFSTPIWHGPLEPDWSISRLAADDNLLDSGSEWAFWRDWYQGFLDGKPMDWELQRRVALIDDAIWEAGPEAVAEEIERVRAAYDVETRAIALEYSAGKITKSMRGIGDNNPPSPIDEALKSSDGVTIIWAAAHELTTEAQSVKPDKKRVLNAINALNGALKSYGLWFSRKVDKGLDAAVIAIGAGGGAAGIAWVTQNGEKIQELIEAAKNWLPFLP